MQLNGITSIFFYILSLEVNFCQRRLKEGSYPKDDKRYMVYFVKSNLSQTNNDAWLCGGAIISTTKIITAAACLMQLNNIYAIAGYRFYVNGQDIDTDECTRRWKQRVVKICVHRDYILNQTSPTGWLRLNIGVATVEKPYDFHDLNYRIHCSYVPAPIAISYQQKEIEPGNNVLMLGWGQNGLLQPQDLIDKNGNYLQAAVSRIQLKRVCIERFQNLKALTEIINNASICVAARGSIDVNGDLVTKSPPNNYRCSFRRNANGTQSVKCEDVYDYYSDYGFDSDYGYRKYNELKKTNDTRSQNMKLNGVKANQIANINGTRRQATCQNDQGSPLVTWVGISEVVIGVALISEHANPDLCVSPSIFYSTYAAKDWLQCLLAVDPTTVKLCAERAKLKGYDIQWEHVNWRNDLTSHADGEGTAKEEHYETAEVQLRPQVPIH